ncbi:uncharacterized protein PFL1_06610 [Pseudozyma flocculosa PF-1]|uniref:DNA repair metallo-beta-lactamase domain-containing protein n=1 Tax=Pseudozyma flocculosa PF-1 TaxID=1277687 RepID=A0A061H0R2_9BASI|nr:uncharacterized protein PFL1_06610 [Pseudozyma flocculosa PF-1]EPQ25743.1 hypothetical protein PFL1_06610 [Pseudozyma flocculosa PF-1]
MFPISHLSDRLQAGTMVVEPLPPPPASAPTKSERDTAFSILMKPHSEAKQWATADAVEAANYRGRARNKPSARTAPFYKVLEGMPLSVDAFRFGRIDGCRGYFLSHFHSDHYGGLSSSWNHGPVYCSVTTANLCRTSLGVDDMWLRPLPMEVPTLIPDSGGVTVTCIDANHCPGSCLFLFEGPQTASLLSPRSHASPHIGTGKIFRYLHCGDFRASPVHTNHPQVKGKKLDIIYLDTTYCNPRYCFPAQDQVVEACAELVRRLMPVKDEDGAGGQQKNKAGDDHEEEEDWRVPPRLNASARVALAQSSAAAKAFKGWLGVDGRPQGQRSDSDSSAEAGPATTEAGKVTGQGALGDECDDEEPLLEDEDSVLAARGGHRGMGSFDDEEQELWHQAALRSTDASPAAPGHASGASEGHQSGEASPTASLVKQEDADQDSFGAASANATAGLASRDELGQDSLRSETAIPSESVDAQASEATAASRLPSPGQRQLSVAAPSTADPSPDQQAGDERSGAAIKLEGAADAGAQASTDQPVMIKQEGADGLDRAMLPPASTAMRGSARRASSTSALASTVKREHGSEAPVGPPRTAKQEDGSPGEVKKEDGAEEATNSRNWLAKQSHASKASVSMARQSGRLLVVVGTYTIGKEKVVKAVARQMKTKVFCVDSRKYRVYAQLEDPELHSLLTRDPNRASVHVTNLHAINADGLRDMVAALRARGCGFTHAIAFRPTGWTYKPPTGIDTVSPNLDRLIEWNQARNFGPHGFFPTRDSTPEYMIYGVPYSEHSSFFELTSFALSTRYDRIIATVNVGSHASRAKMSKWFDRWAAEKRKRAKAGIVDGPEPRAETYW